MKILCVIPARGGSKRVPLKNILPICGRPALAWTVDHIREAKSAMTVALLTDSQPIAEVAQNLGVKVIDEPADIAGDAADESVYLSFAVQAVEDPSAPFDLILDLPACVPIRPAGIVDALVHMIQASGCDFCQTVAPLLSHVHPYRALMLDSDARVQNLYAAGASLLSQQYPPYYVYTGAGVAITRDALRRSQGRSVQDESLALDRRGLIHAADACVDIDTPQDVLWAEFLLSRRSTSC